MLKRLEGLARWQCGCSLRSICNCSSSPRSQGGVSASATIAACDRLISDGSDETPNPGANSRGLAGAVSAVPAGCAGRMFEHVPFDFGHAIRDRNRASPGSQSVVDQNVGQSLGRPTGSQDRRRIEKYDHYLTIFTLAASASSSVIHFLIVAAGISRIGTVTAG
jgi:hypothetical protein